MQSVQIKRLSFYYHAAILVAGFGALLWSISTASPAYWPWTGLVIAIFVAGLVNFPLQLFQKKISLIQVITLGAGLLFGAPTAILSATLGVLLGGGLRQLWGSRSRLPSSPTLQGWVEAGESMGWHHIALVLALSLSGYTRQGLADQSAIQYSERLLVPLLLFAVFHSGLILVDFFLSRPEASGPSARDLLGLSLIEIIPLPFILITVIGYPSTGMAALIGLGGVPIIIAVLLNAMHRAGGSLERRDQEFSTMDQVSQVLRANNNLENLLNVIHQQVSRMLAVDNFYVALNDPKEERIWYPLAVKNGERQNWPGRPLENRLTDRVILERKPIMMALNQVKSLEEIDLPPSRVTPTAWIGVPLVASDRVIGCLALYSIDQGASFTQSDLDLLGILSGPISVGIENALLYEQIQQRASQLEALNQFSALITASLELPEVLVKVCQAMTQVGSGIGSAVFLVDSLDESQVELAHVYQLPQSFVQSDHSFSVTQNGRARCLRTGRPYLSASLDGSMLEPEFLVTLKSNGILAFGDFPLVTPEGQIGFISVYFDQTHVFEDEEVELLQTFASQAALAVANARLHTRTDFALSQRVHQLSILEAVGRELAAATHSERLFEMILGYARDFTNSPWGSIGLYDPLSHRIEIKAKRGYPQDWNGFDVEHGIGGRAVRTQMVINAGDIRLDPDYFDLTGGKSRSQLSIPLAHEGRVLGVLTLECSDLNGYSANDQAFVSQLANQAAIAVINSELYSEIQRRLREQSTLYQVSAQLSGKLELENVLDTIQRAVQAAIAGARTGVYLWEENERAYLLHSHTANSGETGVRDPEPRQPIQFVQAIPGAELHSLERILSNPAPVILNCGQDLPEILRKACTDCCSLIQPLVINQQRLGMAILYLAPNQPPPEQSDLQLLQTIAAQGAISLQNAMLFSDVTLGRDRLTALLNSVKEGIIMVEAGGRIMLVNETIHTITGLHTSQLIDRRFVDLDDHVLEALGYTSQEAKELVAGLNQGQMPDEAKPTLKHLQGNQERFLERAALTVWGSRSQAIGWMLVVRDVSEEQQIAQARELITQTLVHDLRSPLSAILGAVDVIEEVTQQEVDDSAEVSSQALQVVRRSARRVLSMVESLLDIARMRSGSMELNKVEVDLHKQASAVLADFVPLASEIGVVLRNEIPTDLPKISADASKLARVMTNLVDNALKFTPSGGEITINAEQDGEASLVVKISDTGPGIPDDFHERIFERYTQVPGRKGRWRGSGLGLTFCRLAVEAHGGRIWVDRRPGSGSVFSFTLPLADE